MEYFNLNDGQSAIVRILHKTTNDIEVGKQHRIVSEGKNRVVKCLGDDCPLCKAGNSPTERFYIHLWDYTDNTEKVWNRTCNENFLETLKMVEQDWGPISECVVRIKRVGTEFPKYEVSAVNANQYEGVNPELIGKNAGYMCASYRSVDELQKYLDTGVLPDHIKKPSNFIPKEEWIAKQKAKEAAEKALNSSEKGNDVETNDAFNEDDLPFNISDDGDSVFTDPFANMAKV